MAETNMPDSATGPGTDPVRPDRATLRSRLALASLYAVCAAREIRPHGAQCHTSPDAGPRRPVNAAPSAFAVLFFCGLVLFGRTEAGADEGASNPFQIGRCERFEAKDVARLRSVKAGVEAYFAAHPSTETLPAVLYGREQVLLLTSYATWSVVLDGQGLCSDEGKICAVLPPAWIPAERRAADADVRDPVESALAEAGVPGDWRRHEDSWLRFSYPASWEVPRSTLAITIGQAGKSRTPIITRVRIKWPESAGAPRFTIERQVVKGKDEGLEDRAVFRIGELHVQGWRLLSPVEHPAVPGAASCVLFAMEEPRRVCEDASGGMQECHRAMLDLECRRANADRLLVSGMPSPYPHGGAVDGPALEQIAAFKRLLCGIALP